jgi:hypothetical protein
MSKFFQVDHFTSHIVILEKACLTLPIIML